MHCRFVESDCPSAAAVTTMMNVAVDNILRAIMTFLSLE
jgi:hypothetical protein